MRTRTRELLRDGGLTLVALLALSGWLRRRDSMSALQSPAAAVVGVVGALTVEWVMLARPAATRRLWEQRAVRLGSLAGVVGGGVGLGRVDGRAVATLCWGLVAYLGLVLAVLVRGENPLARLVNR